MHVYKQSLTQANLEGTYCTAKQHKIHFSASRNLLQEGDSSCQETACHKTPKYGDIRRTSQMVSNDLTTGRLNEIKRFGPGVSKELKKTEQSS